VAVDNGFMQNLLVIQYTIVIIERIIIGNIII
jgi:hypothetical protein